MTTIQIYLNMVNPVWQLIEASTTSGTYYDNRRRVGQITDLGEAGYRVVRPIPYEIERVNDLDFFATIRSANIAMSGTDWQDAYQALVAQVLDIFDTLTAEANLAPAAAAQLNTLRAHIVRA